ncbi:TetR/AcrR family transcriptional regulator [Paenibacillus sp. FSL R7-0048]|jgi:AcrR family transcriptional regulator|uniref:TetR/AcrR family transcriptional regulator n=2 Tax=Paenibacillus TaxID=44249 RepID=UPI00096EE72F|nr:MULTISPECIES: TetR/AcrR family transcriptional regulator [Paenibacillus]MDH6442012.1 AcrR family transcriptional regulator [Paenibacillus sp. PastF-4]MDH6425991.1 AcrR family transcriptional regulator [Paenibacillus sp. PastH-4]MDH6527273.1 AcrR family transcriptional regulator [Paenibacillus sp. PastH-3]OMC75747.1 TetR family transcriptional regulator [Paenibacillus odorifer]OMC76126.1 TetR family transcriptional regulator [Paenibacillus odorifer]
MNGFEKRAAQIKLKIMKTTMEMLKNWEPKRLRIADIAKEAGVSQVTIYNYFGSKEALLSESFKDFVQKEIQEFEDYIYQEHSLKEIIGYILTMERETYSGLSPATVKELMVEDQEMFHYIEERYANDILPVLVKMVEDGKARGEISNKVSTKGILSLMGMYMRNAGELLDEASKQEDMDAFIEEAIHIFFYGICGKE